MKDTERTKWSRIKTSLERNDIVDYFKSNNISDSGQGYSSIELDGPIISAVYNERISNSIISRDYNGTEFEQNIIEFYSVQFSLIHLINNSYILSIVNPPKTLRPFIDNLTQGLNYKIGIASLELNARLFLEQLSSSKTASLIKIKKVKANSVTISSDAKATIEVTSKKNAIDDISLLLKNNEYYIDKLKLTCIINDCQCEIELSKSGSFCASFGAIEVTRDILFSLVIEQL